MKKFEPTLYKRADLLATVEEIKHTPTEDGSERNRLGVLLGNVACPQTKTLTHVLWSLLNSIPAKKRAEAAQAQLVALDLAVAAKPGVYTLMGKEIDTNGDIVDPIRCDWTPRRGLCDAARVVALAPQRERRGGVGVADARRGVVHAPTHVGAPVRG